jgi:hypothetical protein
MKTKVFLLKEYKKEITPIFIGVIPICCEATYNFYPSKPPLPPNLPFARGGAAGGGVFVCIFI